MAQTGTLVRRGNVWLLRYKERLVGANGKVMVRCSAKKVADFDHEHRTEAAVRNLEADEIAKVLGPLNARTSRPTSGETLAEFIEHRYLPAAKAELKPSSQLSLDIMFRLVKPHLNGIPLREVRTSDIERILRDIASEKARAQTSLNNARNFLSGVFRYALRTDALDRENPVRAAKTPKGLKPDPENCHAYTLEEITALVKANEEPARTVLLTIAWSGLRPGEVRGLKWEDVVDGEIIVRRSVWTVHETETKTGNVAAVPMVPMLAKALAEHRKSATGEYVFSGPSGKPMNLANLARRVVIPALQKAKLEWHGWYGFRRGLASNLYRAGVPDMVIQRILRHANVATTQRHYVKTSDPDAKAAMKTLAKTFRKK
jgi:integrase